jgi:hypothetical protein
MIEFNKDNLKIDMEVGLIPFDQGSIAAILYPDCDVAEKFGVEGLQDTDMVFSVIVYADRSFLTTQYTIDQDGDEEHFGYEPSEAEKEVIWEILETCSQQKYGCTLEEFPAVFQKMCQSKNEVTLY